MTYKPGDVVEFQLNFGGEPVAKGLIIEPLVNDYRVQPQGRDQVWVVHPEEIKRVIGHIDMKQYLSARSD